MRLPHALLCTLLLAATARAADLRVVDAARAKDAAAVRTLISQRADVNVPQPDGATALHWAAHWDNAEMVDALLAAGANVRVANEYGATPLMLACSNANAAIIGKLLKAGADANAAIPSGETVLMTCARSGSAEGARLLVEAGARMDATDKEQGQNALMWAVAQKHADVTKVLLEKGADFKARSKGGFSPLMFAARVGDIESARALLAAGADVNEAMPFIKKAEIPRYPPPPPSDKKDDGPAPGTGTMTPLIMAAASGHEALAQFLLEKGANPNAKDEYGATALHYAMNAGLAHLNGVTHANYQAYVFRPNLLDLTKALLARGADPNARLVKGPPVGGYGSTNTIGATPFLLAAVSGDANAMRILQEKGADPRVATKSKLTPLMVASGVGRAQDLTDEEKKVAFEAVKLAVEMGNDVNAQTEDGLAALHGAALNGADDIVNYLASKGANLDIKDKHQQTPLTIASGNRLPWVPKGEELGEILRPTTRDLLLKLGAKPLDTPGYFTAVETSYEYQMNQSQRAVAPPAAILPK
jgi:ankyrin repeat protein